MSGLDPIVADEDSIRQCLALLRKPPDEDLLLRYYESEMLGLAADRRLSRQEVKWVKVNLRCNRQWQESLRRIRRRRRFTRPLHSTAVRVAAAVILVIVAPLWIDRMYRSGGPTMDEVDRLYGQVEEVVRGEAGPAIDRLDSSAGRTTPSFEGLRDLDHRRGEQRRLNQLQSHLRQKYEASSDRIERAEVALMLSRISLLLDDADGVKTWRYRCVREEVLDCFATKGSWK